MFDFLYNSGLGPSLPYFGFLSTQRDRFKTSTVTVPVRDKKEDNYEDDVIVIYCMSLLMPTDVDVGYDVTTLIIFIFVHHNGRNNAAVQ